MNTPASPLHLRWELYPVPHEAPERAAHGGSYFEQSSLVDAPGARQSLGNAPRDVHRDAVPQGASRVQPGALAAIVPVPFRALPAGRHGGAGAAAPPAPGSAVPGLAAAWPGALLRMAYLLTGVGGLVCTVAGASALLLRRTTDPGLRPSTAPADLANLAAFIAALSLTGAGYLTQPAGCARPRRHPRRPVAVGHQRADPRPARGRACGVGAAGGLHPLHAHVALRGQVFHLPRGPVGRRREPAGRRDRAADGGVSHLSSRRGPRRTWPPMASRTWADIVTAPPPDKSAPMKDPQPPDPRCPVPRGRHADRACRPRPRDAAAGAAR
ncbi:MAG: hypothetical protein M0C28_18015 [Candidatus Moduliflexus flocculans]|nr:hypothetical protein [Candidatus Moduliflexus flocculans]